MRLGEGQGPLGPNHLASRREWIYLGAMAVLLAFSAALAWLGYDYGRRSARDEEPDRTPGEALPRGEDDPVAAGSREREEEFELPLPPGPGADEPEPLPAEFLQRMQASLQAVEDGSGDLDRPAFDLLVEYCHRVGWPELHRQADPGLALEVLAGARLEDLSTQARAAYSERWRKARGQVVELQGKVIDVKTHELGEPVAGLAALSEAWILFGGSSFVVYVVDFDARVGDVALVKGVFFKYRRFQVAGGVSAYFPVLVAKGFGGGPAGASREPRQEERALAQVRDLTNVWQGPGLNHLLQKFMALPASEFETGVVPGLLDLVDIPWELAAASPAEILEAKGGLWKEHRGRHLVVTGTIEFLDRAEIEGVPGLERVQWGQIKEEVSGRRITFAVAEETGFEEGDKVTLRGAFYKMWRYPTKSGESHNSPFIVGGALENGTVRPVFRPEDLPANLESVVDRVPKLHVDSYYYLLWWLSRHADAAGIEEEADPELAERLFISQYTSLGEEELERFRERWREARGKPVRIAGRLVYLYREDVPAGRMPEDFAADHLWTGAVLTRDYHLYTFTSLERGEVEPDEGVVVDGIFFKEWRYVNRRGEKSDTIHLLSVRPRPLDNPRSSALSRPLVVGIAVLSFVTFAGLLAAVVSGRREGTAARRARRAHPEIFDEPREPGAPDGAAPPGEGGPAP